LLSSGQNAPGDANASLSGAPLSARKQGFNLFLVGFLVLFLELACIRWFAAHVIFLQFFTNVVLIACFLGMSCGCLAARRRRDWLAHFPALALVTVAAALAIQVLYHWWSGLAIDVGHQASAQEVFFGTEYRNPDVAQFAVPMEVIVAGFFVLIALMFVGLGQVLGRAFDACPNRVLGYTMNIGGSLAGIIGFSLISFVQAPPPIWFLVGCAGIAYLLGQNARLTHLRVLALAALIVVVAAPGIYKSYRGRELRWSPYYAVDHKIATGEIGVNTIGHQHMVPFERGGSSYSLIHLLQKHSGGEPFRDVLVIGAGSGNDLAHALRFGARRIDAVEIDPTIQRIGIGSHPDRPYQDARVVRHLDDGRHFLRTTDRTYDLVVYALVDSLILHSGYSNIRLESYLFTEQAFADIRRVLKPDGIFVTYNFFRQGWIVERVAAMAETVFGCTPIVISLPYLEKLTSSASAGFTTIVAGCNPRIAKSFGRRDTFWLNVVPSRNMDVDGFAVRPQEMPPDQQGGWQRIAPTRLVRDEGAPSFANDDWPFLYLRGRLVPDLSIRSIVLLGGLGVALVYLFLPGGRLQLDSRMFFLGAAFMLLETKAVVQLALLFGGTWLVNSLVFFTVLIMVLLANLYVLEAPAVSLVWHYAGLLVFLGVSVMIPLDVFLAGGILWRYVVPCGLALGPMFFAGVIFARSFRDSSRPDHAFGSNIAGSVVGGLSEPLSMLVGFRHLLLLAMVYYLLSIWSPSVRGRAIGTSH
jgi:SAM-dependent methyltransferase